MTSNKKLLLGVGVVAGAWALFAIAGIYAKKKDENSSSYSNYGGGDCNPLTIKKYEALYMNAKNHYNSLLALMQSTTDQDQQRTLKMMMQNDQDFMNKYMSFIKACSSGKK
tara:strand:+ start:20436 stop:20768 length:333 start_codon:yes stop_codon:yes gene_type:complete